MTSDSINRILFVSHVLDGSGAPTSLLEILRELPCKERLNIFVLSMRRGLMKDEFSRVTGKEPVVLTENPPANFFIKGLERIVSLPKYIYHLLKINPDLVVVNSAANSRAILFAKLLGYKTYVYIREYDEMFVFLSGIRKKFCALADKVFVLSEEHKDWFVESVSKVPEIKVLPNGINLESVGFLSAMEPDQSFLSFRKRFKFLFCNVGFMSFRKGWDLYLEVMDILKKNRDIGFVILGDFSDQNDKRVFLRKLKEAGLLDRFFLTGIKTNVFSYLKYMDVVTLTSRSETFSRVVLESMALGKPLVLFKIKGVIPVIGRNYPFFVRPFDVKHFAEVCVKLIKMEEKGFERLKSQLQRRSLLFNIKKIASIFCEEILN